MPWSLDPFRKPFLPSFGAPMSLFVIGMRWSILALALSPLLAAQDGEMAERLFSSGERAYASKGYPEAVETWNQLLQVAPKSPFAAHALMRLARYQVDIEQKPEAALPLIERIKTEYLKTPWASEAMLLRGKILADRNGHQDLKEALAEFNRVVDLFPDSPEAPEARFLIGSACQLQGQWGRALQSFTEVVRLDPATPLALKAQLQAAEILDITGDTTGCLRMLQSVRNRQPLSAESREAAWRINVRVKQRILKAPLVSQGTWPKGKSKWLKTPTLLATGPEGEIYIYQDDLDQAFVLKDDQLSAVGPQAKAAKAMFVTPAAQVWLVSGKVGLVNSGLLKLGLMKEEAGSPAAPSPVPSPGGACRDGWGNIWVSDTRASNILVLPQEGASHTLPVNASLLAALPNGGVVAASDAGRALLFLDRDGQTRLSLPYGKAMPASFKTVLALTADPLGHVAALVDGDFEGVALWGPDGALLRCATFKSLGISGKFRAIALDRQGGIILADRSNDLLIRLD